MQFTSFHTSRCNWMFQWGWSFWALSVIYMSVALVTKSEGFPTGLTGIFFDSVARWRRKAWYLDTCGFILKKIQWHIHAGSWSLVNCWWEALTRHYIRCSWILMRQLSALWMASALIVIGVSAWYPNIPLSPWKKRLCLHAKKLLLEIYNGP